MAIKNVSRQILLNGIIHPQSSVIFNIFNRAFMYGDCITEAIHTCAGRICFLDRHLKHLVSGMELALMEVPYRFRHYDYISSELTGLLTKNRIFMGSTLRITVFRTVDSVNVYQKDSVEYVVYVEPHSVLGYKLNTKGIFVGEWDDYSISVSVFSRYSTHDNALLKRLAAKVCMEKKFDDILFLNQKGNFVSSLKYGNLFIIKGKKLYTTPLEDGCCDDVITSVILESAKEMGYEVNADVPIRDEDLISADEAFLVSTETGFHWILGYKTKRYVKNETERLFDIVNNKYLKEDNEKK